VSSPSAARHSLGVYVINLDRTPDRWAKIRRDFAGLPWPIERVKALDGKTEINRVLAQRGQSLAFQDPPHGIGWNLLRFRMHSLVEEATFCSHILAWRQFLESSHAHALILEDDAEQLRDVASDIDLILASGVAFDVVKLQGLLKTGSRLAIVEKQLGAIALVRSFTPAGGCTANLVSRAGARRLIDNAGKLLLPVDDYVSNPGLHGCRVLHASPWPIRASESPSTMGPLRAPFRHLQLRTPWHFMLGRARRARLRLMLWWSALMKFDRYSFALRMVPW
jgi:GR25 family glycosyltransferase involved in LPS biosynthesis